MQNKELKLDLVKIANEGSQVKKNKYTFHIIFMILLSVLLGALVVFNLIYIRTFLLNESSATEKESSTEIQTTDKIVSNSSAKLLEKDTEIVKETENACDVCEEDEQSKMKALERDYLARCIMAEAGNQDELGKRLVCDVVLNRVNSTHFPDNIIDVITYPNAFAVVTNGSIDTVIPTPDIYRIVDEELESIYNTDVVYFRTSHFHSWGIPLFQHQDHYFSAYEEE